MTREELLKTHPDYDAFVEDWKFHMRSYFGGRLYREGNYLMKHPFESPANHARRKETSYYYNYCGPVVDILVSHLFRKEAVRDYGSLTNDSLFDAFYWDADLEGNTFRHFMREAQRFACIYGRVSVVVDKPSIQAATRAQAAALGVRPYVTIVTPENLLDWSSGIEGAPAGTLESVKIREADNRCRIWTRDAWELWEAQDGGDGAILVDSGMHGLGEVPVVNLFNKRSGMRMIGISDLQDIADINRNIYYLCSDAREIIENTAFPMLALPYARGAGAEREVGPHNIIQFEPSEPNAKPYWLEAPHSSLTEIREWVRQDIAEIYRIARLGGVKSAEESRAARSAAAMELEYQQLYSVLSEKADNIEQAEMHILRLWAAWQGKAFDGSVNYPDEFSLREIDRELEAAITARTAGVPSSTFEKEIQKKIAASALPKLDEAVMAKINSEIDSTR